LAFLPQVKASSKQETIVSKLRVESFAISLDGFGAGTEQSLNDPLGKGGQGLHEWAFSTATFQQMFGKDGGTTGIDKNGIRTQFSLILANTVL
jgi:hypothetical protein